MEARLGRRRLAAATSSSSATASRHRRRCRARRRRGASAAIRASTSSGVSSASQPAPKTAAEQPADLGRPGPPAASITASQSGLARPGSVAVGDRVAADVGEDARGRSRARRPAARDSLGDRRAGPAVTSMRTVGSRRGSPAIPASQKRHALGGRGRRRPRAAPRRRAADRRAICSSATRARVGIDREALPGDPAEHELGAAATRSSARSASDADDVSAAADAEHERPLGAGDRDSAVGSGRGYARTASASSTDRSDLAEARPNSSSAITGVPSKGRSRSISTQRAAAVVLVA